MTKSLPKRYFKKAEKKTPVQPANEAKKTQFPSIFRSIPERLKVIQKKLVITGNYLQHHVFVFSFAIGFLLMGIGIVGYDVWMHVQELQKVQQERRAVEIQILYWKEMVEKYQGYRDGLFQLALLEYQIGNKQAAGDYANKALAVDPLFPPARKFLDTLEEK